MDIDYKDVIDFSKLKEAIDSRGFRYKFIADKLGVRNDYLSRMFKNQVFVKTDMIAKICYIIKILPSEVVDFKIDVNENKKRWFEEKALPYEPASDAVGELTYEPLRAMMNMYLDYLYDNTGKEKTVNDLFDMIEPYRRRNEIKTGLGKKAAKAAVEAKYGKGYTSERTRVYVAKGLIPITRTKLKFDRPLNIRTIYDICNFFGCSIDWVMSYK